MKNYLYILWDWDGCLAKTLQIHLDSYKKVFAEFGIYPSDYEITHKVFGDWNGPKKLGVKNIKQFTKRYLNYLNRDYPNAALNDYAKDILIYLKKINKKLALLTTSEMKTILPSLKNNKVEDYFEVILSASDVKNHKPDPEIIYKALESMNGTKNEAIIIGDSKSDLKAAENAKIDSVLFYPKQHKIFYDLEFLKTFNPTFIVSSFIELKDIIT